MPTLTMAPARMWLSNADPGVSETNVEIGNWWRNTVSGSIFMCNDSTAGIQSWYRYPSGGSLTQYGVLVGSSSGSFVSLNAASNGTVLTGVTGGNPTFSATPSVTSISIGTPTITSGSGAPVSSQPKGSLYLRTDGSGVNDRFYIASDSIGGWTAGVTVA